MKRKRATTLVLTCIGAATGACSPSVGAKTAEDGVVSRSAETCFRPDAIVNFRTDRDTTAYVGTNRRQVFVLQGGFCRGLSDSVALRVSAPGGGGTTACVGDFVDVVTAQGHCRARVESALDAEAVDALPSRLRP